MTLEQYKAKLEEWKKVRELATGGKWYWQDRYNFREHLEHQKQGLDVDCENIREGRMTLEPGVLGVWFSYADDAGLEISIETARFIELAGNHWTELINAHILAVEALDHLKRYNSPKARETLFKILGGDT